MEYLSCLALVFIILWQYGNVVPTGKVISVIRFCFGLFKTINNAKSNTKKMCLQSTFEFS